MSADRADVVIRGAKLHQTGMLNSHEILVMPTLTMRPGEEDWAVCFAVPTDAEGIRYIYGRQASDTRKMEDNPLDVGNPIFGGQEVMTVFDDVFVPEERVFLDGEVDFSGLLVERFAAYHRQSYGGCKVGVGDVLIGAAALIADMNGVDRACHIKDKIVEMIHLNETIYSCGIACSATGKATPAGNYQVDLLLANVCKLNVTRFPLRDGAPGHRHRRRAPGDHASAAGPGRPGGGPVHPKVPGRRRGSRRGRPDEGPPAHREPGGRRRRRGYLIESMHGAGPPMAQRIMIGRQASLEDKISGVKRLLSIGG